MCFDDRAFRMFHGVAAELLGPRGDQSAGQTVGWLDRCGARTICRSREIRALVVSSAFHGCEIPYLFGMKAILVSDVDRQLSETMAQYWINFAATGDPNGSGLPTWPNYDGSNRRILELGDEIRVLEHYRAAPLDVIDEFLQVR